MKYIVSGFAVGGGTEYFYTGKAGAGWISERRSEAFSYDSDFAAKRRAAMLNNGTPYHSIKFTTEQVSDRKFNPHGGITSATPKPKFKATFYASTGEIAEEITAPTYRWFREFYKAKYGRTLQPSPSFPAVFRFFDGTVLVVDRIGAKRRRKKNPARKTLAQLKLQLKKLADKLPEHTRRDDPRVHRLQRLQMQIIRHERRERNPARATKKAKKLAKSLVLRYGKPKARRIAGAEIGMAKRAKQTRKKKLFEGARKAINPATRHVKRVWTRRKMDDVWKIACRVKGGDLADVKAKAKEVAGKLAQKGWHVKYET